MLMRTYAGPVYSRGFDLSLASVGIRSGAVAVQRLGSAAQGGAGSALLRDGFIFQQREKKYVWK